MNPAWSSVLVVPVLVLGVVIALFTAIALLMRNWIRVPPNRVAIISGRRRKLADGSVIGFRLVHGGATMRFPGIERVDYLDLNVMTVGIETQKAYTKEGVPVTVQAVANVKIGSDDLALRSAAERFLSMNTTNIKEVVSQTLEAHLRAICGTLTVEEINSDRQAFGQKMVAEAAEDLRRMGLVIDVLAIQHVSDEHGYLDALGRKRTAEVVRDAEIGEAEAKRDSMIRTAAADREGQTKRAEADVLIAEAGKIRDIRKAEFSAQVLSEQAKAGQAGPLAHATAAQDVKRQEVRITEVETQSRIAVAQREAERRKSELEATIIAQAEAERQSVILRADGEKQSKVIMAEADAKELEFEGLGEAAKISKVAEAESQRVRLIGEAEADAIRAKGIAEAQAMMQKAEALKQYGQAAMLQLVVQQLPEIARAFAQPLSAIDRVSILELGGGGADGQASGVRRFMTNVGGGMAAMNEFLKANFGVDVATLVQQKMEGEQAAGSGAPSAPSAESAAMAPSEARPAKRT